ncbi:Jag N-terminal domain-containing protein [bacterium]|nr:Jag N-terminal domain-containing protein [bacterium]MBU1994396.1 Jag N-terminal domain-containing protein [bacterium]
MIKIEAVTLEDAYKNAASSLNCSVTQLKIEVIQYPSKGILGLFKKSAIIVAVIEKAEVIQPIKQSKQVLPQEPKVEIKKETVREEKKEIKKETVREVRQEIKKEAAREVKQEIKKEIFKKEVETPSENHHTIFNDTIMPQSFVSTQDDEEYELAEEITNYMSTYEDDFYDDEEYSQIKQSISDIAKDVKKEINVLFDLTCFNIDEIEVSVYDENTLLIEFNGEDAALLIGKEGYRYKALSYMIFNWINTKYQIQLRLEIAEFLKNQEESVSRYLVGVCESVNRDARAQTKILDGVLVQIALKELRNKYPDKYVAIRSTRDGMKYIIINDYHAN